MEHKKIVIKGLKQNNLKNISLDIPKQKIVVFTRDTEDWSGLIFFF